MKTKSYLAGALAAAVSMAAMGAQAATLFNMPGATPEMATNNSVTTQFNASAGPGEASFVIDGYGSLDGQNYYEDDFSLSLNGKTVLVGTFNLGGGGTNAIYTNTNNAVVENISMNGEDVTWAGGHVTVDEPLDLIKGLNTLAFSYTSLGGPSHAGFQGLGDEGWGLEKIAVNGGAAVPEPGTWAMMIVGFAGVGGALRARRRRFALA